MWSDNLTEYIKIEKMTIGPFDPLNKARLEVRMINRQIRKDDVPGQFVAVYNSLCLQSKDGSFNAKYGFWEKNENMRIKVDTRREGVDFWIIRFCDFDC